MQKACMQHLLTSRASIVIASSLRLYYPLRSNLLIALALGTKIWRYVKEMGCIENGKNKYRDRDGVVFRK
jgi:hypothetical protein